MAIFPNIKEKRRYVYNLILLRSGKLKFQDDFSQAVWLIQIEIPKYDQPGHYNKN